MTEYARGRETSPVLTEARTVLSRAETAARYVERELARIGTPLKHWVYDKGKRYGHYEPTGELYETDPDAAEILEILQETVRKLDKFRRTGATKKQEA